MGKRKEDEPLTGSIQELNSCDSLEELYELFTEIRDRGLRGLNATEEIRVRVEKDVLFADEEGNEFRAPLVTHYPMYRGYARIDGGDEADDDDDDYAEYITDNNGDYGEYITYDGYIEIDDDDE